MGRKPDNTFHPIRTQHSSLLDRVARGNVCPPRQPTEQDALTILAQESNSLDMPAAFKYQPAAD